MESGERRLLSLQIGKPHTVDWQGEEWTTAIRKTPVQERLFLSATNVTGDKQANRKHHGGPEKAVCCFPAEHYAFWRETLGLGEAFGCGAFGENFTLLGMTEEQVCIGDVYAVGAARVQVASPRQPCANLARRWNYEEMPKRLMELGQTGYYLRVLQTGEVGAGDAVTLVERLHPQFSISILNRAKYQKEDTPDLITRLAALPELAHDWRRYFRLRASQTSPKA